MKREGFFAKRLYPILFMIVITVVFIAVVSGLHFSTRESLELNESLYLKEAVLYAANIPYNQDDIKDIERIY